MHSPPARQANSDTEQNDVLFGLGCPNKRPNRWAFVWQLPIRLICSAFRWAAACTADRRPCRPLGAAHAAQRAQNCRQKHVCFCLFGASWRPVFLFEETDFLCEKQIDPPLQAFRGHPMRGPCIFVFARTGIVPHSTPCAC